MIAQVYIDVLFTMPFDIYILGVWASWYRNQQQDKCL